MEGVKVVIGLVEEKRDKDFGQIMYLISIHLNDDDEDSCGTTEFEKKV